MQIVGGMAGVLDLSFPLPYMNFLSMFGAFFRFNVALFLGTGCWSDGSYTPALLLNIALVGMVAIAVYVSYWVDCIKLGRRSKSATEEEVRDKLKLVFGSMDTDGQGINRDELTKLCAKNAPSATAEQVDALFDAADTDGGGRIDFDEFLAAAIGHGDADRFDLSALVSSAERNSLGADAAGRMFLLTFLLYPGKFRQQLPPCRPNACGFACWNSLHRVRRVRAYQLHL